MSSLTSTIDSTKSTTSTKSIDSTTSTTLTTSTTDNECSIEPQLTNECPECPGCLIQSCGQDAHMDCMNGCLHDPRNCDSCSYLFYDNS